jgi:hypothetical protein
MGLKGYTSCLLADHQPAPLQERQSETIAQPVEPLCPYRDDSLSDQHNIHHLSTEHNIHHLSTEHNIHHLSTEHNIHHLSTVEEHQRLQAALGMTHLSEASSVYPTPVYPSGPTWPEPRQSFNGEQDPVGKSLIESYKPYATNVAMAHNPRLCSNLPALPHSPLYGSNAQTQCAHGCSGVADTTSGYHGTPMMGNGWQASSNTTHVTVFCLPVMFAPQACCSQMPSQYGTPKSFCGH